MHFSNKHGNECNHFRCYLCSDQIFHDRLTAELHITMQHSQQLPAVSCSTPSLSLVCSTYQEMNIGIFREYLPTFQCPFCQQNFKEEHLYFLHVLNEHGESNDVSNSTGLFLVLQLCFLFNSRTKSFGWIPWTIVNDKIRPLPRTSSPKPINLQKAIEN